MSLVSAAKQGTVAGPARIFRLIPGEWTMKREATDHWVKISDLP